MIPVRSFTAFDLIRLPRLDAANLHSLARGVLAAAEGQTLSESAKEALDDVVIAADALRDILKTKSDEDTGPSAREADANLDAAWSAIFDFLTAWSKLRDEPKANIAAEIRERLYPDGLKFTKVQFTKQWTESDWRLSLIKDDGLITTFDALGGRVFVDSLERAHRVYGDVLGLSKAQPDPVEEERLRDRASQLANTLRSYILYVSAMVRKNDPASQALVDKLLAPVATWQSAAIGKASPPSPTTPEIPALPIDPGGSGSSC